MKSPNKFYKTFIFNIKLNDSIIDSSHIRHGVILMVEENLNNMEIPNFCELIKIF